MDNCVFCKIIKREIPCYKVYEDDEVLAFLDISQTTKGHTLVVPKEHFNNFLFTPQDIMDKVMNVAQRIAQAEVTTLGAKGVNIIINNNEAAGQTVLHFHVRVIPRYTSKDALKLEFTPTSIDKLNLPALAKNIKDNL